MKNRVILYICCSFGGSSEQLQGETLPVGEDTQGVHNEDFRKHTHRHELARLHCHCEEAGNYRGFSGDKSGHNHATCKGLSRVEKTAVFSLVPLTTKQFLREALHLFVGLAGPQILCAGL